jgi:hypothetical protein
MTCRCALRASYIIATQRFKQRTIPVIAANPWYLEHHAGGDRLPEKGEVEKKHVSSGWRFSWFAAHLIERDLI